MGKVMKGKDKEGFCVGGGNGEKVCFYLEFIGMGERVGIFEFWLWRKGEVGEFRGMLRGFGRYSVEVP
jgi:hypothetical protein